MILGLSTGNKGIAMKKKKKKLKSPLPLEDWERSSREVEYGPMQPENSSGSYELDNQNKTS